MGGIAKGIGKVFKAVGGFVKKYWKPILIAVAAYFTCGLALSAMAPAGASAFAGSVAAVEGTTMTGMAVATATAGEVAATGAIAEGAAFGATDAAAAAAGGAEAGFGAGVATDLGGAASGLAGADAAAGTGALADTAGAAAAGDAATAAPAGWANADSGFVDSAAQPTVDTGTLDANTATIGQHASDDFIEQTGAEALGDGEAGIASASPTVGGIGSNVSMLGKVGNAAQGFWGGMSAGEKVLTASTLFNAAAGFLKPGPTRAQQGLWPGGAYMGMNDDGTGVSLGNTYNNAMTGGSASTAIGAPSATTPQGQSASEATQAGSSQLATTSPGASQAQSTTSSQATQLDQSAQKNADFIQSTMQRLSPNAPTHS